MSDHSESRMLLSPQERKKQLIADGERYRYGLTEAREEIHASLRVDSLARTALSKAAQAAITLAAGQSGLGKAAALRGALPLLISGLVALSQRAPLTALLPKSWARKAALGAVTGLAAVIAIRSKLARRNKNRPDKSPDAGA